MGKLNLVKAKEIQPADRIFDAGTLGEVHTADPNIAPLGFHGPAWFAKAAKIRRMSKTVFPATTVLTILAVAEDMECFTSGQVLRETAHALGEAISVTTLHRLLPSMVDDKLIIKVGPITDDVTKRAVMGYSLSETGANFLRCADALDNAA